MVYCSKCGTLNPDSSTYCSNCGELLTSTRMDNTSHYYKTKDINAPLLIVGIAALVVFSILGVFLKNGPYFSVIFVCCADSWHTHCRMVKTPTQT